MNGGRKATRERLRMKLNASRFATHNKRPKDDEAYNARAVVFTMSKPWAFIGLRELRLNRLLACLRSLSCTERKLAVF